jgi:hypothetical protein
VQRLSLIVKQAEVVDSHLSNSKATKKEKLQKLDLTAKNLVDEQFTLAKPANASSQKRLTAKAKTP